MKPSNLFNELTEKLRLYGFEIVDEPRMTKTSRL